ncbi:hypothetical protein RZS08_01455, partial [Arthrospira platensis SPKY1]|nr:hypothetical protein [Arthrospira platensis SPKY1]
AITRQTSRPYNVNFFCHQPPTPDPAREARWRQALMAFYQEFGIDPGAIPSGPGRLPFSAESADVLELFKPPVVSFHFGLPAPELLDRLRGWGTKILSTVVAV